MKTVEELLKDPANWAEGFTTRDGRAVRIFVVDDNLKFPVVGWIHGNDYASHWKKTGSFGCGECEAELIPRPVKHKGWVLIGDRGRHCYHYQASHIYATREQALASGREDTSGATACIEVEFKEGDGL